jgi:hypothetical protein
VCIVQGLRCGTSRPPVSEQRLINRLHAEKMKRRKDAVEAKAERKRKRKAAHDKARQLARAEGKPRPATPESSEEDEEEDSEEASDAEDRAPRGDGEGASPLPFYLWDEEEGATVAPEEPGAVAGSSANPTLEGAVRGSSSPATGEGSPAPQVLIRGRAGEESSVLAASSHRADTRGAPSGQSSRDSPMPQARKSATRKRSMSARSG